MKWMIRMQRIFYGGRGVQQKTVGKAGYLDSDEAEFDSLA